MAGSDGVPAQLGNEDLEADDDDEDPESIRPQRFRYSQMAEQRLMNRARDDRLQDRLRKLKKMIKWDEEGPEGKAGIVFRTGLIVLLFCWTGLLVSSNLTSRGNGSMVSFLLKGDWEKGVNMFALCSATLIIIVQIGDLKGVVQQIGVRSTKLLTLDDNNAVTISNHSISTVVNLSRKLSGYALCISIDLDSGIEEVEAILNRELPDIAERCPGIVGELRYRGIKEFGGGGGMYGASVTLLIDAQCNQRDLEDVNLFVNREVLFLFKREGIAIR